MTQTDVKAACCTEPSACPRRVKWLGLAACLLVCLGVRAFLIAHTEVIARDGITYVAAAQGMASEPLETTRSLRTHPAYPASIALVHAAGVALGVDRRDDGWWDLSGQIVSLLASLAATAALWLLAGMAFNWQVAWVTAVLFSATRKWAMLGADVLTDAMANAWQIWAVVLALLALGRMNKQQRSAVLWAAGAGLCIGGGYLTRPETLVLLLPVVALWLAMAPRKGHWKLLLTCTATAVAVTLLTVGFYMVVTGRLTNKTDLVLTDLAGGTPLAAMTAAWAGSIATTIQRVLAAFFDAQNAALGVLTCLLILTAAAKRTFNLSLPRWLLPAPAKEPLFMMLAVTALFLPMLVAKYASTGTMSHRYIMLSAILCAPLAGAELNALLNLLAATASRLRDGLDRVVTSKAISRWTIASLRFALGGLARWAVLLGILALLAGLLCNALRPLHEGKLCYRQAGELVGGRVAADRIAGIEWNFLLTDWFWVLHYSHSRGGTCPSHLPLPQLTEMLIHNGVTYLVLDDMPLAHSDPSLIDLDGKPGITAIGKFEHTPPDVGYVRVYRIHRENLVLPPKP